MSYPSSRNSSRYKAIHPASSRDQFKFDRLSCRLSWYKIIMTQALTAGLLFLHPQLFAKRGADLQESWHLLWAWSNCDDWRKSIVQSQVNDWCLSAKHSFWITYSRSAWRNIAWRDEMRNIFLVFIFILSCLCHYNPIGKCHNTHQDDICSQKTDTQILWSCLKVCHHR